MSNSAALKTIHSLITSCKDCEQNFQLFAHHTREDSLREHYLARAGRCQRTARELRLHLINMGEASERQGSLRGWAYRTWLRVRAKALSRSHSLSWLRECSDTEVKLLKDIRRAAKSTMLPEPLQRQVTRDFHAWQHIHSQMRLLRRLRKHH